MATKTDMKLVSHYARPLGPWETAGARRYVAGQPDELLLLQMLGLEPYETVTRRCDVHDVQLRPRVDRGMFCHKRKQEAKNECRRVIRERNANATA